MTINDRSKHNICIIHSAEESLTEILMFHPGVHTDTALWSRVYAKSISLVAMKT